jgi:uncharacterized protein (UPF0210 family)
VTGVQTCALPICPLKYISELTGKSLDQVVNWYIIILMLVFDPLAIALVIAANFAFEKTSDKKEEKIEDKPIEKKKEKEEEVVKEQEEKKGIPIVFKRNNSKRIKITDLPIKEKVIENKEVSDQNKDTYNNDFDGFKVKKKIFRSSGDPTLLR